MRGISFLAMVASAALAVSPDNTGRDLTSQTRTFTQAGDLTPQETQVEPSYLDEIQTRSIEASVNALPSFGDYRENPEEAARKARGVIEKARYDSFMIAVGREIEDAMSNSYLVELHDMNGQLDNAHRIVDLMHEQMRLRREYLGTERESSEETLSEIVEKGRREACKLLVEKYIDEANISAEKGNEDKMLEYLDDAKRIALDK